MKYNTAVEFKSRDATGANILQTFFANFFANFGIKILRPELV